MKLKRFIALIVSAVMVLAIVPALTVNASQTTTVTDMLGGEVVWSAPNVGNLFDAAVSDHWDGWTSSGNYANIRTYDGYDVLQFYAADQTDCTGLVTASQAVQSASQDGDMLIIEWKHKWQEGADNCYYDFYFKDVNDTEIAFLKLDKNAQTPGASHPDANNNEIYAMGFPANYTPMALVVYNNGDGATHTVDYYVNGEKVYTQSDLAGTISGFKQIQGHNGWWSNWSHIGFADLTIATVKNSETTVEVTANYTIGDRVIKTETKRYDSAEEEGVTFPAFYYSANGENALYLAEETTLSQSGEIELSTVANTGEYKEGNIVAYDGVQYRVTSDNLIPNSDFTYGLAGWYNGTGSAADSSTFKAEDNTLTITGNGGTNSASCLSRAWDVEVGKTYFMTFTLDEAIQWARVTEGSDNTNSNTSSTLIDKDGSVKGKNNLVFTASDEFVRISLAWAEGRQVSSFGLYEIEEADEVLTEEIKTVYPIDDIVTLADYEPALPETVKVEGTLGSIVEGTITWDEPASYPLNETVLVSGTVSATFAEGTDALTQAVSVNVTVFDYDHTVETFWHAGDDSNSPSFSLYNYINNYNGGVIIAETAFTTASGTNKLIMYGNASTGNFSGAGALLRYMNTQVNGEYVFEYHDGDWKQSSIICDYNASYVLRTTIDITNKKYTMAISANGGEFVNITPAPAAFRNSGLTSIDRMISTGSVTFTSHKTAWVDGFSYLNVEYVDENGASLRDGYRVKAATGVEYTDLNAPKMIEDGDTFYLLPDVNTSPSLVVAEGEDTLSVTYHQVTMTEFESPYVNHVRGDAAINLPNQVKMVFSDGQKILYNVTWNTDDVDTENIGEYEAVGTIDGLEIQATATVNVRDLEILDKTTENTVVTNNGGWNWYVEPSGTHIQPGDALATRYESGQYSSNNGYVFKHDKTYMGWVEDEGTIVVGEYDHDTDTYKRVVVHEFLEADDHNNPAVVVLPDGRIMIFYSKHTTEDRMYYCVSKNPEDISEWNDWQYYHCYTAVENSTYNATYPSVFMVHDDEGIEGNDVIYVGWRGVHWKPTLAKFSMPDENGIIETVMGQTQFANTSYWSYDDGGRSDGGRRPYTKYDYDFDRNKIYITFTANHPDNDVNNHIYYVTLDITDQNLYTAKGTLLQPLPFENKAEYVSQGANGTNGQWGIITNQLVGTYPELLVFDANAQITNGGERRGWTWDIKVNENGEPCIVYVDVTATAPGEDGSLPTWYGPNVNDSHRSHHYYWYARWDTDTQTWVKTFLTYGGKWWHENATQERCYSGGLTFDHNATDANVIYLSIPTMGEHGNIFEIYRWESDDHGATWTIREPITENSTINNVRPNAIYNYKVDEDGNHQGPRLLWKSGEYRYWMNYEYKTGVWTDFAADGFVTQDDPEMFADASLYIDGEKAVKLPTGEATVTGKFNITNISIGDGEVYLALAHYNADGTLVNVTTSEAVIPARSVPQIGMVGAPKTADGGLSPMGNAEIVEEIEYTATFNEGDTVKLFAWNKGIEHPMSDITSVVFEMSTEGNKFDFVETFTYDGTEKLILDENGENFNGWIGKAYGDGAAFGTHSYAAITKAPFGNTGLHLYHVGSGGETGSGAVMASHALPDSEGKDYQIKFSMRYIDEMSWNNTTNSGFTLSHGVPVYNDGNATPCAIQFRHSSGWKHYNGRGTEGWLRRTRWFDGGGMDWIFGSGIYSEYGRGNEYDALMTGSNYEVTIDVSPSNKTISFSIFDGHRTVYHTENYVDANNFDWDNNPIDTLTFSVGNDKWGEIYVDDVTVEIMDAQ